MNDDLILSIAERLRDVRGVAAVVLGGSHGRGAAKADSDYDLGIYFDAPQDLDITALNQVAKAFDDGHRDDVCTPVGGWGPWVVGGGWLVIGGQPVDFIYRELARVQRVAAECQSGQVSVHYQAGHPYGFVSSNYAAEAATCRIVWQRAHALTLLKAKLSPYPLALKRALTAFAWEAGFCASIAKKPAQRGDRAYVHGALFRGVMCLTQALFAHNEQWWLNEKGAVELATTFTHTPTRYAARVNEMFASELAPAIELLEALDADVQALLA